VCIVDATGKIVREAKVRSEREAVVEFLQATGLTFTRIGLEAGPLSQWLYAGLVEARTTTDVADKSSVLVCVARRANAAEARHV
jgi:transposase